MPSMSGFGHGLLEGVRAFVLALDFAGLGAESPTVDFAEVFLPPTKMMDCSSPGFGALLAAADLPGGMGCGLSVCVSLAETCFFATTGACVSLPEASGA